MAFSQGSKTIDLDYILNNVGELNLLSHYFGISDVPCLINSPLRPDRNPSFSIYYSPVSGKIVYKDFGNKDHGGIIDMIMQKWNMTFIQVMNMIDRDKDRIPLIYPIVNNKVQRNSRKVFHSDIDLQCRVRNWRDYDIKFWETYGISPEWLKFGDIYPISHIIITKNGNTSVIPADKYAYAYVERKDNVISLKIYQPFNKEYKWSNKHDSSVWDLWAKLPEKGENLIITSSRKDALCIWENTGIPSTGLQAESYLPKEHVVQQLKDRFKNVFILYDNDFNSDKNYGRILGAKFSEQYNLKQIEIPEEYQSKDTSDLCKNHSRQQVRDVILKLIDINNNENK